MLNCESSNGANNFLRSMIPKSVTNLARAVLERLAGHHDDVGVRDCIAGTHRRSSSLRQSLELHMAHSLERYVSQQRSHLGDPVLADCIHLVCDQHAVE